MNILCQDDTAHKNKILIRKKEEKVIFFLAYVEISKSSCYSVVAYENATFLGYFLHHNTDGKHDTIALFLRTFMSPLHHCTTKPHLVQF